MKTYYVGQRLFSLHQTIGKTVSRTVYTYRDVLQVFTDGSFWFSQIDDNTSLVEDVDISCELAVSLGIANEEAIKDYEQQKINGEKFRTEVRRKQYDQLRKEFEGGTP